MYKLQQEIEILESKTNKYRKVLEIYPDALLTDIDYISQFTICLNKHLKKVNKLDVFTIHPVKPQTISDSKNRIVLHAKNIIDDISIYSFGIDFASFDYYHDLNNFFNAKRTSGLQFNNYHEELKALKISDTTIKNIEMYIYNKYLIKQVKDYTYNQKDYIPQTFQKLMIFNG